MKILHATAWYPPVHIGGTEIYVAGLARELQALGVTTAVVVPVERGGPAERQHLGIRVLEYPVRSADAAGLQSLRHWLEVERPEVFHLHTWTPACGLDHLRLAHEMGVRTVWTPHVPAPFCLRGTMLHQGVQPCDGHISVSRCGACWAQSRGLPGRLANIVMRAPSAWAAGLGFRAHDHVEQLQERFAEAGRLVDRIVCVSGWLRQALRLNGVPAEKLVLSRQGVDETALPPPSLPKAKSRDTRVGFIGRWDPVKGLHVLVEAFKSLPDSAEMGLSIYVRRMTPMTDYERRLRHRIGVDRRIQIFENASREDIRAALSSFDALAVPSQCLETGPLSVLEAAQAGVPVLGSNIGGIAEWLGAGITGWAVPFDDIAAWRTALLDLPQRLRAKSRSPLRSVRCAADVARDMVSIYQELVRA